MEDAFALATERARTAIESFLQKNDIEYENITLGNENILEWWDDFRIQQTDDVWKAHRMDTKDRRFWTFDDSSARKW